MTVENTQNKMPPLQMGIATEYPFTFAVLLQDPTEEEALQAIKASVLQADGTEIELVYNTDYTVVLNPDRIGGTLTVNNIRTTDDYITIYRQYTQTQEVDYKDFNSAPAETFEQCFDKLTMLSQQQQEAINRSLKLNISSTTVNPTLPEPMANNTLIWDSEGAGLKNYDIIGKNNAFKEQVNDSLASGLENIQNQFYELEKVQDAQFEEFKTQTNTAIKDFEDGIDAKIETVADAADKINALDESIQLCKESAETATQQAEIAASKADEILNVKDELEAEIDTKANVDLSNLSAIGQAKFDEKANVVDVLDKSQITNCLLEVPQNIKLELNNGVLTLKAGSKVIVPNGAGVFDEVVIENDLIIKSNGSKQLFLCLYKNGKELFAGYMDGGTVSARPASPLTYSLYYNTETNKVEFYTGTEWYTDCSLPIAIVTRSTDAGFTSIDQIFNGFGYIGSTVWADKGIKGLIPNGRNEDGTLRNIEVVTNKVVTLTNASNLTIPLFYIVIPNGDIANSAADYWVYDEQENCYVGPEKQKGNFTVIAQSDATNGIISNFQPKLPFRAVDYNDAKDYLISDKYDGQWVAKSLTLAELVTLATTSTITNKEYDLSSYLPNDEFNYEIFVNTDVATANVAGAHINVAIIGSGTQNQSAIANRIANVLTGVNYSMVQGGSAIIPIGKNRKLTFQYTVGGAQASINLLRVEGYRRIGTNE